jgi:uncharacterized protein
MDPRSAAAVRRTATLSQEIYAIVDRLGEPPTSAELRRIQKLINEGADIEARYNSGNNETLLEIALTREYTEAALLLVRNYADVNARCIQNMTPFIWAAMKGNSEVLQAMFDTGRAPPPDRDMYDSLGEGKTALMCAAEWNHPECVKILIRYGADMNFQNNVGKSALDYAREKNCVATIREMQEATAALNPANPTKGNPTFGNRGPG